MYEEDKSELNETEWNLFSDEHFSSNTSIKHYKGNEDKQFFKWMIQYKHWAIEIGVGAGYTTVQVLVIE